MSLSFILTLTLLTFISSDTGDISSFANYPGAIELIEKYTANYSSKFQNFFKDGPIYSGDGTAYGNATSGGNCMFPKEEYYKDMMFAALNHDQYIDDLGCGLCALVVCDSNPHKLIRIRILDQCPECEHGSLDFSDIAFYELTNMHPARVKITWALIPCDVGYGEYPALMESKPPVKFKFKTGSTKYWSEVQAYNTLYPVVGLEFELDDKWQKLYRRDYNYWASRENNLGPGPFNFRVTLASGTVILCEGVGMIVPSDDEIDLYDTGVQTVLVE